MSASSHLVIHRRPHPSGHRRWFRWAGRSYAVQHGGPDWGYEIFDIDTMETVETGSVFDLYELRKAVVEGHVCDYWWADYQQRRAERRSTCGCCEDPADLVDEKAGEGWCARCAECSPPLYRTCRKARTSTS